MPLRIRADVSGSFSMSSIVLESLLSMLSVLSNRYEGNSSNCSKYSSKTFFRVSGFSLVAAVFNSSKLNFAFFVEFFTSSL